MAAPDVPNILTSMLSNLTDVISMPDRSHQGVLNHLMSMKMMLGGFASDPNVIFNGASVVDTSRAHYWGISQGGILVRLAGRGARCALEAGPNYAANRTHPLPLFCVRGRQMRSQGTVVMAASQDVQRGHLGVPGTWRWHVRAHTPVYVDTPRR